MDPPKIKILNQEIDRNMEPSYYRMLVDGKHFKYITIEAGTYDIDDLCFPPDLIEKLPQFPPGEWNSGRIARTGESHEPVFIETRRENFRSINSLWHSKTIDYLSLNIGKLLQPNISLASSPHFDRPVIIKYARFDWEIGYYVVHCGDTSILLDRGAGHRPRVLGALDRRRPGDWIHSRIRGRSTCYGFRSCCLRVPCD